MPEPIEFAKLSGSGNDFICIDGRDGRYTDLLSSAQRCAHFARVLCRRGLGVGADGVIFALHPEIDGAADLAARFFEADGSEAELCGNGTGCFVRWAFANRWADGQEIKILTTAGVVRGKGLEDDYVRVCIPLPENLQRDQEIRVAGAPCRYDFVVTGVPHVITYVQDVDKADVARLGPLLRHHERFKPRGANANFVQVIGEGEIAVRTWEFGVEGETLACGTGSAAAAILTAMRQGWPRQYSSGEKPIRVRARSGDVLRVYFTVRDDGAIDDVCLETLVRFVYHGRLHPEMAALATGKANKD